MSANGWLQFTFYCLVLLLTVRPVGIYLARVAQGELHHGSIPSCVPSNGSSTSSAPSTPNKK